LARGASDAIYSGVPRVRNFVQGVADTPQGQSIDDLLDEWLSDFPFTVPEQGLFTPRGLVQRVKGGVSDQAQGLQGTQETLDDFRKNLNDLETKLDATNQAFEAAVKADPTFPKTKDAATLVEKEEELMAVIEELQGQINAAESDKRRVVLGIEQFLTGFSTDVNNLASIKALETGRPGMKSLKFVSQNLQSTSIPPGELHDWIREWLQDEAEYLLSF
jgi:chromosome segregation ATPase